MSTTILALDPGGTTGWAFARWERDASTFEEVQWNMGHLGPEEHHLELYNFLGMQHTQHYTIVTERFEYRNTSRPGLNLMSREYIGVTKMFVAEREIPIVEQNASQAKGFVKDPRIKDLGLWYAGHKHAMDAVRHLIYYIVMCRRPGIEFLCDEVLRRAYK